MSDIPEVVEARSSNPGHSRNKRAIGEDFLCSRVNGECEKKFAGPIDGRQSCICA